MTLAGAHPREGTASKGRTVALVSGLPLTATSEEKSAGGPGPGFSFLLFEFRLVFTRALVYEYPNCCALGRPLQFSDLPQRLICTFCRMAGISKRSGEYQGSDIENWLSVSCIASA